MIFLAGLLVGIVLTSIASFALLGLCLSSRERDEREAATYPLLEVPSVETQSVNTAQWVSSGPPEPPPWVNGNGDAA